ncbi:hypothetical protein F8388_015827 [Cannabis sativa]|uniref:Branched-chain-amino-acid aminotransferase n=1 Tax=Cannabis sativa TaxID=3483 RepID=A0A7J6FH62_CANSA|nr:hypothetical protein F8388_015827 [Cannabis sativa]
MMKLEIGIGTSVLALPSSFDVVKPNLDPYKHFLATTSGKSMKEDGGLLLFRPDQNGVRMKIGAERMCMPSPSVCQFVHAVKQTVLANKRWSNKQEVLEIYAKLDWVLASSNYWSKVDNFKDMVNATWSKKMAGFSMYRDVIKIKWFKRELRDRHKQRELKRQEATAYKWMIHKEEKTTEIRSTQSETKKEEGYMQNVNFQSSSEVAFFSGLGPMVPPCEKGSLYVRPLLIGTGPVLGLAPAPEYTFLVYASPVGNYFKEGLGPLSLYVEDEFDRASRGGTGFVKTISNYSPKNGFSDVLYLDSINKRHIEEASSSNIFIVKGDLISTPAIKGTILSGVTRRSIIEIALDHGYKVKECDITVDELMEADEVFCTGTAVGVAFVGSITYHNKRVGFKTGSQTVSHKLYTSLVGIQRGVIEDKKGWIVEIA